jgi:hypothetical protein
MKLDELRTLFAYDSWANELLLDAARNLPEESTRRDLGTSHQSLLGTLVHLVAARRSAVVGAAPRASFGAPTTFEPRALSRGGMKSERGDSFVGSLAESDLDRGWR